MTIKNRYDFVLFFDVQDGNPNGDPDAGNLPRIDPETGMGLVTDVCLKRKIRNYITITKEFKPPYDIYVKERSVLGREHFKAFQQLDIQLGEETAQKIPDNLVEEILELALPDGLDIVEDEDENSVLKISAIFDKKEGQQWLKEGEGLSKNASKFFKDIFREVKTRKPSREESDRGKEWMCKNYFDIRTFGAVMALKKAPSCGQVRGPIQFTFARSLEPVVPLEHTITRVAVATEEEAAKERMMGRKYTIPYGLYLAHGFISPHLAAQTGFTEDDLTLFWEALENMFDHDRSAARGLMATRRIVIFKHQTALGNRHAQDLFDRVTWKRKEDGSKLPARSFSDYEIFLDGQTIEGLKKEVYV